MGREAIYLTRQGYEKLREQLEYLKTVCRREIVEELSKAIAHGDLSENAEYDAAKEAQAENEIRITELEKKLTGARIIDEENIPAGEVWIGATVKLKDLGSGEELKYTLVSEEEADYLQGKISISSPVGKGLLGHKENDIVQIKVPAGILRYKILKISR
jgi:transcription elongation factor GreA